MKKAFTLAAIALGSTFALSGVAHAEPNGDPARFAEWTTTFVSATDPGAINAKAEGKNVIMSPYGTAHTIACRGNGAEVPIYDCMQQDDLGWISLRLVDLPAVGPTWTYFP